MTAYNNYMTCISKCGATDVSCYQSCATVYQNELMDGELALFEGEVWENPVPKKPRPLSLQ